jgi:hypothetical protein
MDIAVELPIGKCPIGDLIASREDSLDLRNL